MKTRKLSYIQYMVFKVPLRHIYFRWRTLKNNFEKNNLKIKIENNN